VKEIKKMGGEAVANGDSVADFKAAKRIVECAIDSFGKLNIVVNNAGILRDRMIFNMGEERLGRGRRRASQGHVRDVAHACEYWREEHKKGNVLNGRIINTASDAGSSATSARATTARARPRSRDGDHHRPGDEEVRRHAQRDRAGRAHALTVDATPSTAALMGQEPKPGEFDMFNPANIAPLVAWLASDDAAGVNGRCSASAAGASGR
jgi:NAD(P)-dependent dehydrogenase (short-subunit alcohol dehydrogenase family)